MIRKPPLFKIISMHCQKINKLIAAFAFLCAAGTPLSAHAQTVTLTTSGSYTVPANVYQISVVVRGAGGGAGGPDLNSSGNGGSGAAVTALINVTPGQVFNANVGRGGQPGRW